LALRRPLPLIAIVGCVATLVLTNVRSAWLAVAVGVVAYLVLSPKRAKAFGALAAVGLVSVVLLLNASTLLGNATITQSLQSRFDSLGNVDEDESVSARRAESNFAMHQGLEEPLGQGLGTVGGAVKLGDTGAGQLVLDNGYLSRFLEMGVAGFICYVATLAGGVIFGVRALVLGFTTRNPGLQQLAVTSVTVQCALAGLDLSSDYHSGLPGMFFWIALGLALRFEPGDDGRQKAWESVPTRSRGANGPLWA
jgi:O-antigen ligase